MILPQAQKAQRKLGMALAFCVCLCFCSAFAEVLDAPPFTITYTPKDEAVAQRSAQILRDAVRDFDARLPLGPEPVQVMICGSYQQFRQNAGAFAQARVGGIAKSHESTIIVKAPRLLEAGSDYGGMLRHELIHVLLARNTNSAFMPRWFNEGLAMVVSRELRWSSRMRIARMFAQRRVIPYLELNFAFAPRGDEQVFGDAYAQALSMTEFLLDRVGEEQFWQLVGRLKTQDFGEALKESTGLSQNAFYEAWRRSLWKVALIASLVSGLTAFDIAALLVIAAYFRKRRHGKRIIRRWEQEEAAGVAGDEDDGRMTLSEWEAKAHDEATYAWEDDEEY